MTLGIRAKLLGSFFGVALFTAALSGYDVVTMERLNNNERTMYVDVFGGTHLFATYVDLWSSERSAVLKYLLWEDPAIRSRLRDEIAATDAQMQELTARMDAADTDRQDVQTLANVDANWRAYMSWRDAALRAADSADGAAAVASYESDGNRLEREVDQTIDSFLAKKLEVAAQIAGGAEGTYNSTRPIAILLSTMAVLFGLVVGFILAHSIAGAAYQVARAARGLARGELNQRIEVRSRDELGEMAAAFRDMIGYQQEMVRVANAIAERDLTQEVRPRSRFDVLGTAFQRMSNTLRDLVGRLEEQAALLDLAHDAILVWDFHTGAIRFWNRGAEELYGWTRTEAHGRTPQAVLQTEFPAPLNTINAELIRTRRWEGELVHTRQDGTRVVVASRWALQEDKDGRPVAVLGINSDVTERKRAEAALEHQALHDGLTGLPNRTLFNDRLEYALAHADRECQSVAVLFLDLDNFKAINDSFGHEAGDTLLIEVAQRLRACLRVDDTVARLGGDEFTLLVEEGAGGPTAEDLAQRIAKALSAPVRFADRDVVVSASIGIALGTPRQSRPDTLLRKADTAMYQAKAAGKARYAVFDSGLNKLAIDRLEMETDLRHAAERDQLRLHYQPIYSLADGHISEIEALVRWERPGHGLVQPGFFIPVAEKTGVIVSIGQWVLEEACRQVCVWHAQFPNDPPVVMSVNLSGRQFEHPGLLEDIEHAVQAAGLDPRYLKFEVTESVAMQDAETTITKLWALKALGIQLAIDDFGTGYSSLGYLRRFPVDTLKVDRSFVERLGQDAQNTAIVQSVVELAKTLHLSVTGEGIETQEQESHLRALGCDRGQGYLFARPVPAEGIQALLSRRGAPVERLDAA